MEITVYSAELAYYANYSDDNTYTTPSDDLDSFFAASKGHTLVCLKFTVKNTDRTDVSIPSSSFGGRPITFYYQSKNGKKIIKGYDVNFPDGSGAMNFRYAAIGKDKNSQLSKSQYDNAILGQMRRYTYKLLE